MSDTPSARAKLRVLVADDHPAVLRGTCELVDEADDMHVVATARSADEAIARTAEVAIDVLLLDVHMPGGGGVSVVRALRERDKTRPGIVMLSASSDEATIVQALRAGAHGYLLKTAGEEEIHRAVRLAAAGRPAILQAAVREVWEASAAAPAFEALTERETEILKTLAKDLSNKEIASRLCISDRTVQQHLANVFGKLGVNSRTGAVLKALQLGYLTLEDAQ